ncbi:something about silencing protein 10 [Apteryx rowi]|uniref:something about silencing protein 10 n=1 Tax=Apteryx rowi TaxID=308060 RepID=UPI000E1D6AF5|nr:something about silencing protein 10 [Apteryx rowi]
MRTRRGTVLRPPPSRAADGDDDDAGSDEAEVPAGEARPESFADEVEDFHEAQFQAVMAALESGDEAGGSEEEEEEVLGLELPEEDSEEEEEEEEGSKEEEEVLGLQLSEDHSAEENGGGGEEEEEDEDEGGELSMDSDLEEHGQDTELPHELSWGQRKQLYYDTDYGSDARAKAKRNRQEVDAEEEEEEEEAQVIQRRLVQDLGEDDYGLDVIQDYLAEQRKAHQADKGQKIAKDFQALSKKEQLKLLKQESPELLQLIEDFEVKLMELKDELHPLLQMIKNGTIPQGKGSRYLQTKYHLYLNYCANISFYLVLKSKRMPVHSHPVIERLVAYRNIINDLAVVDQKLSSEVRLLLKKYYDKKEDRPREQKKFAVLLPQAANKNKPKLAPAFSNGRLNAEGLADESDLDEEAALQYYKMMEEKLKLKRKRTEDLDTLEEELVQEEEDPNKKRGVTYQMIKNKGLTPRRKKIDRNPRVKHREKFRRAKIRRKGQVREVRRELHRYAGELSGIRAGVKKSRKLQ